MAGEFPAIASSDRFIPSDSIRSGKALVDHGDRRRRVRRNPWASTFLDTFRYLYEHGRLAQNGVRVIMHNALASSDYGLLDDNTFAPRPNYWAALVWRKLMGTPVLDPGLSSPPNVYFFAHCFRNHSGRVATLAINADPESAHDVQLPNESERYTLSADQPEHKSIKLNGRVLAMGTNDDIPAIVGVRMAPGSVTLAPRTISFFAVPNAGNNSCR